MAIPEPQMTVDELNEFLASAFDSERPYRVINVERARVALAVTSNLNINFLRKTERATVTASAELLKLGRRLVIVDVRMNSNAETDLVAQATVTYAIPVGNA